MVHNRQELKEYILRALGAPLIEIEIDDGAFEDRIDEAILFFQEYYFDGIVKEYFKHVLTEEDFTNKYLVLPDHIWGVNKVFPISTSANTNTNIFDIQYQIRQSDMRTLMSTDLVYYDQVMSHLALLENRLMPDPTFRWNRLNGKVYFDLNWNSRLQVGMYVILDCYSVLDPTESPKFWNNRVFKEYCIALTKKQWSMALKKYNQVALPGGITLDGNSLYQEALQEIETIEQDIIQNQAPLDMFIG